MANFLYTKGRWKILIKDRQYEILVQEQAFVMEGSAMNQLAEKQEQMQHQGVPKEVLELFRSVASTHKPNEVRQLIQQYKESRQVN
jgi:hypothetical protein